MTERTSGSAAGIIAALAEERAMSREDIMGNRVLAPIAEARQEAYLRIRENLGWSFPRIGRFMGRDHTTIMHGVRQATRRREEEAAAKAAEEKWS